MLTYPSGEDINEGDHVRYLREEGTIDFVAVEKDGDPSHEWYMERYSGGVMIIAKSFGRIFLSTDDIEGHLEFIARKGT
jgi:hypothetical protein